MPKLILTPEEILNKPRKMLEYRNYYISEFFTWGDVFFCLTDSELAKVPGIIYKNAKFQSILMDKIRKHFNTPIIVTSWYRTERMNTMIKGAKNSFHLRGLATDFYLTGKYTVEDNRAVQKELDGLDFMQKSGLEYTGGKWTHVDSRGYKARFYG